MTRQFKTKALLTSISRKHMKATAVSCWLTSQEGHQMAADDISFPIVTSCTAAGFAMKNQQSSCQSPGYVTLPVLYPIHSVNILLLIMANVECNSKTCMETQREASKSWHGNRK